MMYPADYDTFSMTSGHAVEIGHFVEPDVGGSNCGVQAQRGADGSWRTVEVVVAAGWSDHSGQSSFAAYGANR